MVSNHAVWGWKAPVKASVSGVSLLQLSPFFASIFPLFPQKRLILRLPGKSAADLYFSHIIPGTRQLCGRIIENLYIGLSRSTLQSKTWVSSHPLKVFHLNGLLTREIMIYSLNILHSIDLNITSTPLAQESRKVYWEYSIPLELDGIPYRGYCVKNFRYSDKKANLSTTSMCTGKIGNGKIQCRHRNKILLNSNNAKHSLYINCSQNGVMHHITIL